MMMMSAQTFSDESKDDASSIMTERRRRNLSRNKSRIYTSLARVYTQNTAFNSTASV